MGSKCAGVLLLLAAIATAQPGTTTITDTLYNGDGSRFSGTVQISSQTFFSSGKVVLKQLKAVNVSGGAFTVALVPNDTSSPANTSYIFALSNGSKLTCTIPTSATPIVLQGNCTFASPTPPLSMVTLSQVSLPAGTTSGQYCLQVVCASPGNCAVTGITACSGSGALSWAGLTSSAWAGMTSSQWASLSN